MVRVLHTFGRNLAHHPHMHSLGPGTGVAKHATWLPSRANSLLPVKALSKVFRSKSRDGLRQSAGDVELLKPIPVVLKSTLKTVYNRHPRLLGLAHRACGEADTPGQASS